MAVTNHERIGKALELLKDGLLPFVKRELENKYTDEAPHRIREILEDTRLGGSHKNSLNDVAVLLVVMDRTWGEVFRRILGKAERSLINELISVRNKWAHQEKFTSDDTYRALDSASRLLAAVSAPQAEEIEKTKMELLRVRFDEQARHEKRKGASIAIETRADAHLKPWREVVNPHKDVASGRYQQAEFAADLWQVHMGEGSAEYRNPVEFYRRTYLTESLKRLLVGALHRLNGSGGDPIVQLQTNFGGGKTHSMLALYHLVGGTPLNELPGLDSVLEVAEVKKIPKVHLAVLVGNKISPGNPVTKADGTVVHTLWGEMAWQLGYSAGGEKEAKKAYDRIKADDENATSPGDVLRELFNQYGPCLILIDEWVAYARQLHDQSDLPAGSFETQFSFAQALTESAKLARNCLLIISLPASDTAASPHAQADDTEVGGQRGREALERLRNVIGRIESSWRPASAEEGFEIVRRRLFEPFIDQSQFVARDTVARAFIDLYRSQQSEFPPECHESDYERRLKAAYPIHPEIFDRLYSDWSTLLKFQRTRGVLRLMAAVIHCLWERSDRNPLILPSNIPIDDPRVQFELTRYLSDNWVPVIEKDVDGPNSLPLKIDSDISSLGKYAACRRVARTVYLGSAPTGAAANLGIEDRRVKLGCAMPGESTAIFGDGLRRLASSATYLYQDGPRYWYATQPTVTKLADDRAEQLKRDPDKVVEELERRLRDDLRMTGDFLKIHPVPQTGYDVPDNLDAKLIVLGIDHAYSKEKDSPALTVARTILESRGTSPRIYRNTLVFLVPDKTRVQDLDETLRKYLAWRCILEDKESLDLSPHQVRQTETRLKAMDGAVKAQLPEAYQWLLVPSQSTPKDEVTWQCIRLTGHEALAVRASKKLRNDELLITRFGGTRLRMELDKIPLWRDNHVTIKQLVDDFARYIYLPRLQDPGVLIEAIRDGIALLTWEKDSFAYAEDYDEDEKRYMGLQVGKQISIPNDEFHGLLVKPDIAKKQLLDEAAETHGDEEGNETGKTGESGRQPTTSETNGTPGPKLPNRFFGSVQLDPLRVGRDAGQIADEVISHLTGQVGAEVQVTLEINAKIPSGAPENIQRTVTENARSLKFDAQGFEED